MDSEESFKTLDLENEFNQIQLEIPVDCSNNSLANKKLRILLVDDEPLIINSIEILINMCTRNIPNFEIEERVDKAFSGEQAIELVK